MHLRRTSITISFLPSRYLPGHSGYSDWSVFGGGLRGGDCGLGWPYLKNELGMSAGFAALGFASFQLAMLIGRFSGDSMVQRFGPVSIVRRGGLIASVGLGIAIIIGLPVPTLVGYMAAGLGLATAYPLAMSAAGNFKGLPRGQSVASVATVGYTGFLVGAPILGWVAEITSLTVTMGVVTYSAYSWPCLRMQLGMRE